MQARPPSSILMRWAASVLDSEDASSSALPSPDLVTEATLTRGSSALPSPDLLGEAAFASGCAAAPPPPPPALMQWAASVLDESQLKEVETMDVVAAEVTGSWDQGLATVESGKAPTASPPSPPHLLPSTQPGPPPPPPPQLLPHEKPRLPTASLPQLPPVQTLEPSGAAALQPKPGKHTAGVSSQPVQQGLAAYDAAISAAISAAIRGKATVTPPPPPELPAHGAITSARPRHGFVSHAEWAPQQPFISHDASPF